MCRRIWIRNKCPELPVGQVRARSAISKMAVKHTWSLWAPLQDATHGVVTVPLAAESVLGTELRQGAFFNRRGDPFAHLHEILFIQGFLGGLQCDP